MITKNYLRYTPSMYEEAVKLGIIFENPVTTGCLRNLKSAPAEMKKLFENSWLPNFTMVEETNQVISRMVKAATELTGSDMSAFENIASIPENISVIVEKLTGTLSDMDLALILVSYAEKARDLLLAIIEDKGIAVHTEKDPDQTVIPGF